MTLLPVHIIAGSIAIIAGFISVFARKGARLHRKSGLIFVYAMIVLGLSGAVIAATKHQSANLVGGLLAFYLATTALLAVRERNERSVWFDSALLVIAVGVMLTAGKLGLDAMNSPSGKDHGVPGQMILFFAAIALIGAVGDVRTIIVGGLPGAQRIARHLWRMCFSLFIASGSFFLGQAKVIPKPIRILPVLATLALLPLVLLLYWLARVLLTKWYRQRASSFRPGLARRSA
jgi:uncharacterized membrane protein